MKAAMLAVLLSIVSGAPALAATFVYVSNAEDDDIGMYTLQPDGSLQTGERFKAEKLVMPMAVSPDKRFLIAAVRSKPYRAYSYSIDPRSGALKLDGALPVNTSGGQLSEAHVEGMLQIVEGARQLQGIYGADRQVPGAEIALISGHGGNTVCHSTLILGKA